MLSSAPSISTNVANCETEPRKDSTTGSPTSTCWPRSSSNWNTRKLGEAVFTRKNAGLDVPAEFLAHVSPLGWEHINLTGEYRWPSAGPRST